MLHFDRYPAAAPDLPPLLIVHGLFGSARNWGGIARRLADRRNVLAVDMRNHGSSFRDADNSYAAMAGDLAQVIESQGSPMDVLGHSMGGKAAMQLALTRPELVDRLIVADIAPVAYGHDQTPHVRAMQALDLTNLTTRAEADRRLALTTPDPALRAFFLQSLDLKGENGPAWRLNLPVLAAEMPGIVGWPGTQGTFPRPALFLAGSDSTYVLPEHRPAIKALFPATRFARIPGAGHWLHADKQKEFVETIAVFLSAGRD
jgi:esterase